MSRHPTASRTPRQLRSLKASRRPLQSVQLQRLARPPRCTAHLIVAPLWVGYVVNLGTLLRTCDAVGACLAVPRTPHYLAALDRGDTLPRRPCIHWTGEKRQWLQAERSAGSTLLGVELDPGATRLADLEPARGRTVVLLGNESLGIPEEVIDDLDQVVEIPMIGVGASLNVAVAGSLVLYKLAGLS